MPDQPDTNDFSFAAVKLPLDTTLRFFATYYARYYAEMFDDDERAAGLGGAGVIFEGPDITTDTVFDYPHLRSSAAASTTSAIIHADIRLCSLSGQPDWTVLNGPGDYSFHIGEQLKALSRAFSCTVYRFDYSAQAVDGKSAINAAFTASGDEGFLIASPSDRVVNTTWDEFPNRDGSTAFRHRFFQSGQPHPAEDCAAYDRRGPRNKMNRQVLLDIMSRLDLNIGSFPNNDAVQRCVLIGDMGEGKPICPTREDIALINQVWPWRDGEKVVSGSGGD